MKNKYHHSIWIAIIGVTLIMTELPEPIIIYRFIGGLFVGLALYVARESGRDENI
jgi:hypothetical protein